MKTIVAFLAFFVSINTNAADSASATITPETVVHNEFAPTNKFSGDFRYRHQETKDGSKEARPIHRLSLRVGQAFQIQPDLKFTYRLMTGTNNNSSNTSIADKDTTQGSPRYSIGLDQAFITYSVESNVNLYLGKMPQFFSSAGKNQVIMDRDITPEGLSVQYKKNVLDDSAEVTLTGSSLWVREKYDSTNGKNLTDTFLNLAQGLINYKIDSELSATIGLGIFTFTDVKGDQPNDLTLQTTPDFKGNTSSAGNYINQYDLRQYFAEIKWNKKPYEVSIFTEQINNNAASVENSASIYGLSLAYEKFYLNYMKQTLESDSVLAIYTNADFASGQTNSRGDIWQLGYKLSKNATLSYSLYDSEKTANSNATDYRVSHLDVVVSF